jgi:hypothetical protein
MKSELPIACILKGADHRNRIAANMALAGSLISQRRDGRTLTLIYPLTVAADVRRMVVAENDCCPFLDFDVRESTDGVRVVITVPAHAETRADDVFAQFVPGDRTPPTSATGCCGTDESCASP